MLGIGVVPDIETGLDQRVALPQDSYLIKYFNYLDLYLGVGSPYYVYVACMSFC